MLLGSNWLGALLTLAGATNEMSSVFSESKIVAKLTGKLLACALVAGCMFENQTVSLMGFSLGC